MANEVEREVIGRYRIVGVLGRGGHATTYRVEPVGGGEPLALKELALQGVRDWKVVELFEREGKTLRELDHPAIPRYVDAFEAESVRGRGFYLAQTIAPGRSLADRLTTDWRPDEAEVCRIIDAALVILGYLHARTPPIIHRDVKPANLILADDGTVRLVDFGAVQALLATQSGGSTLVGSYGFMAPEQLRGQATPAADIYGIAATALYLATRKTVSDLPHRANRVQLKGLGLSPSLQRFIARGLEADPDARYASAAAARRALSTSPPSRAGIGALGTAAVVLVLGGAALFHHRARTSTSHAPATPRPSTTRAPIEPVDVPLDFVADVPPDFTFNSHSAPVTRIAVTSSGQFVATGSSEDGVKLWRIWNHQLMATLAGHSGGAHGLAFSADGWTLYTIDDTKLRGWDVRSFSPLFETTVLGAKLNDLSSSRKGKRIAVGTSDGAILLFDSNGDRIRVLRPRAEHILRVDFRTAQNVDELFALDDRGEVYRFDAENGTALPALPAGDTAALALFARNDKVFGIDRGNTLFAHAGSHQDWRSPLPSPATLVASDGGWVATSGADGIVRIWNAGSGELRRAVRDGDSPVASSALAIAGNGRTLLVGGADGNVREWSTSFAYEAGSFRPWKPIERDHDGWTPLHDAAFAGDLAGVEAALKSGVAPDAQTQRGATALHLACEIGSLDAVKALVAGGAKLDVFDADSHTAIFVAVQYDRADIVAWLLDHGARRDVADRMHRTIWSFAADWGSRNAVHVLDEHDVVGRPQAAPNGDSPICKAAAQGNSVAIDMLVELKFDVNASCGDLGQTALQIAATKGFATTAQGLLVHGAKLTVAPSGDSPAELARRGGYIYLAKVLERAERNAPEK